ncbi:MAG: hypothetical protein HUU60_01100 [Armatimonadetes bacterium]|nr:hypothetical protein [Armatimonadota bacterium]
MGTNWLRYIWAALIVTALFALGACSKDEKTETAPNTDSGITADKDAGSGMGETKTTEGETSTTEGGTSTTEGGTSTTEGEKKEGESTEGEKKEGDHTHTEGEKKEAGSGH